MARAPFTFVVPDGAQPGEVIQVQVLGILARVELPEGTFGGQQLTGTYSREAYGKRWHTRRKTITNTKIIINDNDATCLPAKLLLSTIMTLPAV